MLYTQPLPIVSDELDRAKRGGRQIGEAVDGRPDPRGRAPRDVAQPGNRITVPGWDDVARLGPRYHPSPPELDEYYRARRERREPAISPEARDAINAYREYKDNANNSSQPGWARGWGNILTAIDNVQDFASSVATLGRLALWAGPRMATGLEAILGIEGLLTTGLAARLGGRLIPIVGGAVLAGDILNLLALIGMIGMAGFGVLCAGPSAGLAAGAPMMLLKRGLKSEIWNAARRNPLGRTARLNALSRAKGRLPGIGNLFELGQTTEQLFGWGVSLGGVIGALTEASFAAERALRGEIPEVNLEHAAKSWRRLYGKTIGGMTDAEVRTGQHAAKVVYTAPVLMTVQETLSEDDHLVVMAAYLGALPYVLRVLDAAPWEDLIDELLLTPMTPLVEPGPVFGRIIEEEGPPLYTGSAWPIDGAPARLYPKEYVEAFAPRIASSTKRFLERRGDGVPALMFGTMVGQATESLARSITGSEDGVRFQLAPAFKIISDVIEDGYLILPSVTVEAFTPFWRAMLREHERLGARRIAPSWYLALAARYGVPVVKQLAPTAAYPPEWTGEPAEPAPAGPEIVGTVAQEVPYSPPGAPRPPEPAPTAPAPTQEPPTAPTPIYNIPKTYQRPAGY